MKIKVKFYMMFNCGETRIRTLDDLRENFCVEDVLMHFEDGRLEKWLDAWNYRHELEAVRGLKASGKTNAREVLSELMRIFGAGMSDAEIDSELEVYDYCEERRKFWEYVRSNGLQELEDSRRKIAELTSTVDSLKDGLIDTRDIAHKQLSNIVKDNPYYAVNPAIRISRVIVKKIDEILSFIRSNNHG